MSPRRLRMALVALASAGVAALTVAPGASAHDPGRWRLAGHRSVPLYDYQGITSDDRGHFYFDGIDFGLYRTDLGLHEQARNDDVIPPGVTARVGYNHIGDLTYDRREGGRLLLPMECYYEQLGNTCGKGAIGVADPRTLRWRYYVQLDPRDIPKAMFAEVSPDGRLLWTSVGRDLLAYRVGDISRRNAAPTGREPRPVRRLRNAVPPSGVTGAAFRRGRLFVAGQIGDDFRVYSIDMRTGRRLHRDRLEIERTIVGESEGLDFTPALGGVLHWQIQPANTHALPTYGVDHGTILTFVPRRRRAPPARRHRRPTGPRYAG